MQRTPDRQPTLAQRGHRADSAGVADGAHDAADAGHGAADAAHDAPDAAQGVAEARPSSRAPQPGLRDFLRWRRERQERLRQLRRRGEALPSVHSRAGARDGPLHSPQDSVTWAGHASVIVRLDGKTVLCDPVWAPRRMGYVIRRLSPPAPAWADVPTPDVVTISHNHYDHLDGPTLKRVRQSGATVLVPKGDKAWFDRRRFRSVVELDWWQSHEAAGLRFTFVPSQHFSGRTPWDRDRSRWGGWVVEGSRHTVYHAGDTGYFDGFHDIGRRFRAGASRPGAPNGQTGGAPNGRAIDVACVPIGAYEPRWFMRWVHVNPEEGGQAFLDTGAAALLPIHWGTFRLTDEPMDEPPRRIRAFFADRGLDPSRLLLGDIGQTWTLGAAADPGIVSLAARGAAREPTSVPVAVRASAADAADAAALSGRAPPPGAPGSAREPVRLPRRRAA